MLDLIAGDDHERPLGREACIQKRLSQRLDSLQHLGEGELAPALAFAVGDQHGVRRLDGPGFQRVDDGARIGAQCLDRAQDGRAVGAVVGRGSHVAQPDRAHGGAQMVHVVLP
ncbi:hypothetical protein D3C72_2192620 [compost metagenome]